jgi:hypothetical protein
MAPSRIEETPIFAEDTTDINFWVPLKQDKNYEINDVSLKIRHIETKIEVRFYNNSRGYTTVKLDNEFYGYHRLIAEMFVYNSDPITKTNVDHIDRNKHNNTIENLRWVSPGVNSLNRVFSNDNHANVFVKSLPDNARQITHYRGNELKYQYFIANNSVFVKIENEFRKLNVMSNNRVSLQFKNDTHEHSIRLNCILKANVTH